MPAMCEMTLVEFLETLPEHHLARREFAELDDTIVQLRLEQSEWLATKEKIHETLKKQEKIASGAQNPDGSQRNQDYGSGVRDCVEAVRIALKS